MALQRTQAFLLLLLLTLLGLGLVQPSYGQDRMYQRFLRQHVDPDETGGNDGYCNLMMQRRKMTSHQCKRFNTLIHEDLWNIRSICSTTSIQCKNGRMNCHEGVVKVTDCRETGSSRDPNCRYRAKVVLVTEMASTLKVLGPLLALLFTLCGLLVHSQNLSWREFMKQHHLSTNWEFSKYKCNDLMRERGIPEDKNYHIFIYTLWHKIERICLRNWRDRYRNVYIWAPYPLKTLKCIQKNSKSNYKDYKSYSYIEFHCSMNGFVDGVEDMRLLEDISN